MELFLSITYEVMLFIENKYMLSWGVLLFLSGLFSMTPLSVDNTQNFSQVTLVYLRRVILVLGMLGLAIIPGTYLLYTVEVGTPSSFIQWVLPIILKTFLFSILALFVGYSLFTLNTRYIWPEFSRFMKKYRFQQTNEEMTDIRKESDKFTPKTFTPKDEYIEGQVFLGLDTEDQPIYVPETTWREVHAQIIGATRYGKGIVLGTLIEQSILRGDTVFYVDPKGDKFLPHIMKNTADKVGRPFLYLSLRDNEAGTYQPFLGGNESDAFSRLETAFGLKLTGNPGTDYYKTQEVKLLSKVFETGRTIKSMFNQLEATDANRTVAELEKFKKLKTFNSPKAESFRIDQALKNNAIVYVKGDLDNSTVLTATKVFLIELFQQTRSLGLSDNHITTYIDEVSFLVSQELERALSTILGFGLNLVMAYQSPSQLESPDDKTLDGRALAKSMDVNTQLKMVYGGASYDTAEWLANLSGTVVKEVSRMEKTHVDAVGGETWENSRMIGSVEENLINTNVILSLPPRVCVIIRPQHLAEICFTSFVPVENTLALDNMLGEYIDSEHKSEDDIEDDKFLEDKQREADEKEELANILGAKPSTPKSNDKEVMEDKDEISTNNDMILPTDSPFEEVAINQTVATEAKSENVDIEDEVENEKKEEGIKEAVKLNIIEEELHSNIDNEIMLNSLNDDMDDY